ncbi:MAG: Rhamnulokinase [Firmicutes bacterium ADurb.Bin182]|nr:MAG: Rhamnulokinase [Firmicutes bacterium ADurb.Bin182]
MKSALNLIAFDIGASNGRAVLGRFDGRKVETEELCRFENGFIDVNGVLYWDALNLFSQMKASLSCFKKAGYKDLSSFGIDTWGVDYGLLDKNGRLLGNPISYRHAADEDMEAVWERVPKELLFKRTGVASMNFNTVFQLYRRKRERDVALENADSLLLMPDLLGYFLSGEKMSEYTIVTTSQLYDPNARDWDYATIRALGLPAHIFTPIDMAGEIRGRLLNAISEEIGINRAAFTAVGTHDTASAVAAIPGEGSFAFCSSGTWSLFGVETDKPILTEQVYKSGFSNEGTVQGGFRPLKNIMGLWLIQECRRDWQKQGENLSWDEIVEAAEGAKPLRSIIDPDCSAFFRAGDMENKIRQYCLDTKQPVPETRGEIARCIYESLALKYRWALERLEEIKGEKISRFNIVGGGIKNKLLNQMAADATGRQVTTGPVEGACIGNLLMQAVALGELTGIDEVRQVVRDSVKTETYMPERTGAWEDAYDKLLNLLEI